MTARVDPSGVKKTSWKEMAVRFVFGGLITALAGFIGKLFGPAIGGLFLAFPAILPATVTLVARHDNRRLAGIDAMGAALGSLGLIAFGLVVWGLATHTAGGLVLVVAAIVWFAVSAAAWWVAVRMGVEGAIAKVRAPISHRSGVMRRGIPDAAGERGTPSGSTSSG
jgi:hypothetical protein